jgi:hypothetical protein
MRNPPRTPIVRFPLTMTNLGIVSLQWATQCIYKVLWLSSGSPYSSKPPTRRTLHQPSVYSSLTLTRDTILHFADALHNQTVITLPTKLSTISTTEMDSFSSIDIFTLSMTSEDTSSGAQHAEASSGPVDFEYQDGGSGNFYCVVA